MIPYHIFFGGVGGGGLSIYLAVDAAFCFDFTLLLSKYSPSLTKMS